MYSVQEDVGLFICLKSVYPVFSIDPALCNDPDQPAQSAHANPGRHNTYQGGRGIE